MQRTGQWGPGQLAGRRWAMGCVSLEITQRCNLGCTSLIAYAQRYTVSVIPPDYQVAFTPYDWTVADSRRARLR